MNKKSCKHCKDFNKEKEDMSIYELQIGTGYYIYDCPINYCPACGEKIKNKTEKRKVLKDLNND